MNRIIGGEDSPRPKFTRRAAPPTQGGEAERPDLGKLHSELCAAAAEGDLGRALDAFCKAYGHKITWADVYPIVAKSALAPAAHPSLDREARAQELHQMFMYGLHKEPWGPTLTRPRWAELEQPERNFFLEWAGLLAAPLDRGEPTADA